MTIVGRSRIDIPSGTSLAPSTSTNSRTSPTETNTMGEPNRQRRVGTSPESVCWVLTRGVRRPCQKSSSTCSRVPPLSDNCPSPLASTSRRPRLLVLRRLRRRHRVEARAPRPADPPRHPRHRPRGRERPRWPHPLVAAVAPRDRQGRLVLGSAYKLQSRRRRGADPTPLLRLFLSVGCQRTRRVLLGAAT